MDPINEAQQSGDRESVSQNAAAPVENVTPASDWSGLISLPADNPPPVAPEGEPPAPSGTDGKPATAAPVEPAKPLVPETPAAPVDPWDAEAERVKAEIARVKAEAKAAGYETPEQYRAARQAAAAAANEEQQWNARTHNGIVSDLQAQIAAGDITEAQAHAEYERRFTEAESARETVTAEKKQTEEQIARSIDLETREVGLAYAEAARTNPLLSAGEDIARDLMASLVTSGIAKSSEVLPMFTAFANAVAAQAVANHEAERATKPAVPVLSPGAQAPANTPETRNSPGSWLSHLGVNLN